MKKILSLIFFIFFSTNLFAEELGAGPVSITGTIKSIKWHPAYTLKGFPGMSGTLDSDRTFPAAYRIVLTDYFFDKDYSKEQFSFESFCKDIKTQKNEFLVKLNHKNNDGFLKENFKIKIVSYMESGDEGGIWTSFKKIKILEKS